MPGILHQEPARKCANGHAFRPHLTVHSSLDAVGLTAVFSASLARAGISCNVLAGLYHDHILVPSHQRDEALTALRGLSSQHD
ncbi:MAG: ACT domain-containing protein [Nocardioides sp.]|nr:ACT domain-containing protein [Nocardioides sp.]